MDTQEIKLRLVEAFIAQKTHVYDISEYADTLLEYINKDNLELKTDLNLNDMVELSIRSVEALKYNKITTLNDLLNYRKQDLLKMRKIGYLTFRNIESALKNKGYELN